MSIASAPTEHTIREYLTGTEYTRHPGDRTLLPRELLSNDQSRCRVLNARLTNDCLEIEIEGAPPTWFGRALDQMTRFLQLPENWDSYGANAIDPRCVVESLRLVLDIIRPNTPAPSFVPTRSGGIQFEWHEHGIDLEVEVEAPSSCSVYFLNNHTKEEVELGLSYDLSRLIEFIDAISPARPRAGSSG